MRRISAWLLLVAVTGLLIADIKQVQERIPKIVFGSCVIVNAAGNRWVRETFSVVTAKMGTEFPAKHVLVGSSLEMIEPPFPFHQFFMHSLVNVVPAVKYHFPRCHWFGIERFRAKNAIFSFVSVPDIADLERLIRWKDYGVHFHFEIDRRSFSNIDDHYRSLKWATVGIASKIFFGDPRAFLDLHASVLGGQLAQSNSSVSEDQESSPFLYSKPLFFEAFFANLFGYLLFSWGWGWWSGLYNYPRWPRGQVLADAACIIGAILFTGGIVGILAWSMQL
jgi:hypothetical protein